MTSSITATKRRLMLREIATHQGTVTRELMQRLSARHHEPMEAVRDFLSNNGYFCEQLRNGGTLVQSETRVDKAVHRPKPLFVITKQEAAAIRRGMLYRVLDDESEWVITKRDQFDREREVIIKMLDRLGL